MPLRTIIVGQFEHLYLTTSRRGKSLFRVEVKLLRHRDRAGLSNMQARFNPHRRECFGRSLLFFFDLFISFRCGQGGSYLVGSIEQPGTSSRLGRVL